MLQQTTVKAVAPYYARFLSLWPDVHVLAAAPLNEVLAAWAGLGYYARARNLHACANIIVREHLGIFPRSEDALRALPGIGAYTAAAIAAIAFDAPALPVDGNIERVVSRLFAVAETLPAAKPRIKELAASLLPSTRSGDFAQAFMDLGATICSPRTPACALCPWNNVCEARKRGTPETFPHKTPKREGKLRHGAAFVALREDGYVLLRTRAAKGLLGGMTEVPGSEWLQHFDDKLMKKAAPKFSNQTKWKKREGAVSHTFTHFPLTLTVFLAKVPAKATAPAGTRWVRIGDLGREALPSVMRKVLAHALALD